MKDFFKSNWLLIAALVLIAILGAILFRGCDNSPSHKADKSKVNKIVQDINDYSMSMARTKDSLKKEIEKRDIIIGDLSIKKMTTEIELDKSHDKLKTVLAKLDQARKEKDTVKIVEGSQELQDQVTSHIPMDEYYESVVTEMLKNYEQQLAAERAKSQALEEFNFKLRKGVDSLALQYNVLYTDYTKVRKQAKRSTTLSRIGAGAAAVLVGFLIIKN